MPARESASVHLVVTLFFFTDTATTEIYTLSLHDALPIFGADRSGQVETAPVGTARHQRFRSVGIPLLDGMPFLERRVPACGQLVERAAGRFLQAPPHVPLGAQRTRREIRAVLGNQVRPQRRAPAIREVARRGEVLDRRQLVRE